MPNQTSNRSVAEPAPFVSMFQSIVRVLRQCSEMQHRVSQYRKVL